MRARPPSARRSQEPLFYNNLGRLYVGRCEEVLKRLRSLRGRVNLIFTSPPFPLNHKKRYGNLKGDDYVKWLATIAPLMRDLLTPDGSLVIEIGNAWKPGSPVQSLLPYQALIAFAEAGKFHLCQEITYHNPARLPSPAQWVTVERIRLKDSTSKIWWLSATEKPKADNRRVLVEYSDQMRRLLARGKYNHGRRPSEHNVTGDGFLRDNGGAIPSNLIQFSNTTSVHPYLDFCRERGLTPHPARMPVGVPEFFMRFLTEPKDLVLDPFAGSNTTGEVANSLGRRWVSIEAEHGYAAASIARFSEDEAIRALRSVKPNVRPERAASAGR